MLAKQLNQHDYESSYSDYHISSLAEIYQPAVNICIWQREVPLELVSYAQHLLTKRNWNMRTIVEVGSIEQEVHRALPDLAEPQGRLAMTQDIVMLTTLFADLFELETVGLRLSVLDGQMCPRFHTDNLPCRLVSTYIGPGTQWLPNYAVDRTKLGHVSSGLSDSESGIYRNQSDIEQLQTGDVALLKGSGWEGYDRPIVHRSPAISGDQKRLILTLDFAH